MNNIQQQKLYGLDHLRALAIIYVFLFHYFILSAGQPTWLPGFAKFGWTGVDLFFVLSGFLISSQLFNELKKVEKINLRTFYLKRIFRILPAYFLTVTLYFCIPLFREKEALPPLWKFLTFTQNFGLNLKYFGTFSHAWSLCVEEHFYLFLPLILLLLQSTSLLKKSYWILILLFVLGFIIRIISYNNFYMPFINDDKSWIYWYKYVYYPTYNRLDGLLVGVCIAAIYQFKPTIWNKLINYGNSLILIGIIILIGAYFLCIEPQTFYASVVGFPLVSIGYGLVVIGAICPSSILYKWKSKITTQIAVLSYVIYLTHKGVIHLTHLLLKDYSLNNNLMLAICMITCILIAFIIHWMIEKPFMKLRNRIL